jgi:predicted aldo/keto reductase-like oxidoreductase
MLYNDFQGLKLSALGFGTMRLPVLADGQIDQEELDRMVDAAMAAGVNYYDTAYPYHGSMSEPAIGRSLARYPRESWYLATKFPGHQNVHGVKPLLPEEVFEEQLLKCGVDFFDFYLIHNVNENSLAYYGNPENRFMDYFVEQKKNGRIRHLGFSCHGSIDTLNRFLDAYGDDMEFCQLQLNYLDWTFQQGREKTEILARRGIPVWVMEPLRGGKLAKLAPEHEETLKALRPDEEIPAWAFRFLQSVPSVTVILSGMSDEVQLEKNLKTFSEDRPLNEEEMKALTDVAAKMLSRGTVPCTACHYCVSHCPMGLDIPRLLSLYNEHAYTGGGFIAPMALSALPEDKRPGACLQCRSCEQVCPQQIRISEVLADFSAKLG